MISFSFAIQNPWAKDRKQKDYIVWDKLVSKHRAIDFQISRMSMYDFFSLNVSTCWQGEDHAGPSLTLEVFGYFLNFKIYDTRHWDYEKGCWEVYDNQQ